jgi:hypothetical protein
VWKTELPEDEEQSEQTSEREKHCAVSEAECSDEESGQRKPEQRPTHIQNAVHVGITLMIIAVMLGAGFREVAIEVMVDGNYARLGFLALAPIQFFLTLVCSLHPAFSRELMFYQSSLRKSLWAA